VEATITVRFPLGPPEAYGGVTDWDEQMLLEQGYINDEGDYLIALLGSEDTTTKVQSIKRVYG
jgi:hypothetical protein